jgi:3-methyl-2-oxobutanoate hydroxymethyltransferase
VGLVEDIKPKFVRRYLNSAELFRKALEEFKRDVESGSFPSKEESYG